METPILILLCFFVMVVGLSATTVICVIHITETVKILRVSRSHIHVFNRTSKKLHAEQVQAFSDILEAKEQELKDLKSSVSTLSMQVGLIDG